MKAHSPGVGRMGFVCTAVYACRQIGIKMLWQLRQLSGQHIRECLYRDKLREMNIEFRIFLNQFLGQEA